jgi:hypothetical protein
MSIALVLVNVRRTQVERIAPLEELLEAMLHTDFPVEAELHTDFLVEVHRILVVEVLHTAPLETIHILVEERPVDMLVVVPHSYLAL